MFFCSFTTKRRRKMIEQVVIFSRHMNNESWAKEPLDERINKFLAGKNEKGEYKNITRVIQNTNTDGTFFIITIFYQWVKGMPEMCPYRTPPGG